VNREQWAKMPCFWQAKPEMHGRIASATTGAAIAALKLYIGLCLKANFKASDTLQSGSVKLSIARLAEIVGLSKPTTIAGTKLLESLDLVKNLSGRPTVFRLTSYDQDKVSWTKLPSAYLYGNSTVIVERIAQLGNRGYARQHSLQMYLYLASIRNRASLKATVSYDRLSEVLKIDRNDISRAISMLSGDDLISVRRADAIGYGSAAQPTNEYWLRGTTPLSEPDVWQKPSVKGS
jgi:hypothetical protein